MLGILAVKWGIYCKALKWIFLKNQTISRNILLSFYNVHTISDILKKKLSPIAKYFRNYSLLKACILKCIAGLVSEHPSVVNVLTCPKHCISLQKQTLILGFRYSDLDKAAKRLFKLDLKSQDCMLNYCLPMLGILIIIWGIYGNLFKYIYLKNKKLSGNILEFT